MNRKLFRNRHYLAEQINVQFILRVIGRIVITKTQVNDRIRFPVVRLVINRQSFEQFLFPFEDRFQGGECQRFPEAAGTGEKIRFPGRIDQFPDKFRLVHIEISFSAELFKTVNAAG